MRPLLPRQPPSRRRPRARSRSPADLSAAGPRFNVTGFRQNVPRGEEVVFPGTIVGGTVASLTIPTYFVCAPGGADCPAPRSLCNTSGFIDRKVVPVGAASPFVQNTSTSAFSPGLHISFAELPAGRYSTLICKIT